MKIPSSAGRETFFTGRIHPLNRKGRTMPEIIDIGARRELFVDDFLLDTLKDARLDLKHPERREVSFTCDAPWEDNVAGFYSVFQDGSEVRLYYRSGITDWDNEDNTQCYAMAVSTDGGLTFTRPELGLVQWQESTQNNLLQAGGVPQIPPAFLDANPACPPDQRYKGLTARWQELYAQISPDGLRWQNVIDGPVKMTGTFDTINTAFWDACARCYRSYTRYFINMTDETTTENVLGGKPTVVRAIQCSTSEDFIHWEPPLPLSYHDNENQIQLYTNSILPCPGAEHIYVGFPNRYVQERKPIDEHPYFGVNDALFMSSRDGLSWMRCLDAWVRPGLDPRNWTERNNYPTWGIVETSPAEWSMYISEHYRQPDAPCLLRRLSIRPHGFMSLHAGYDGGEVVTRPFLFSGRELRLNFSTSAIGVIRVEIQNEHGNPRPGFTMEDMEAIYGDELDRPVAWQNGGELSSLIGQPIRLRFLLKDADLYAMRTI